MTERSLQVTYRKGLAFAAYLHLSHPTGEKSARSAASPDGLLIVDYSASGRPLGVEITAPQAVPLERLNQLLVELSEPPSRNRTTGPLGPHRRTPRRVRRESSPRGGRSSIGQACSPLPTLAFARGPTCDVRAASGLLHLDSTPIAMFRTKAASLALLYVLLFVVPATATEYFDIGLHGRVQASDIVVVARVVDPALALVSVERVLKGDAPKQITLVAYVDGFAVPAQRKLLVAEARELMFLVKKGDAYAPVQDQYGRLAVNGSELVDSFRAQPRSLSQTFASIRRLVALQARAARSDAEADAAYVAALKSSDVESQMWALWKAKDRIKVPSPALADALLASWPTAKEVGPVLGSWNAAGLGCVNKQGLQM